MCVVVQIGIDVAATQSQLAFYIGGPLVMKDTQLVNADACLCGVDLTKTAKHYRLRCRRPVVEDQTLADHVLEHDPAMLH